MPKYLIRASYTTEGIKGLMKDGGSARMRAVQNAASSVGGKVEGFYFAFGGDDAYVIVDMPDVESSIAVSLVVNASGAVRASTTPLITPEEMDRAAQKSVSYRPPGG